MSSRLLSKHINLLAKIAREERKKGSLSPWDETLFPDNWLILS
jgi:hypothetical protein